MVLVKYFTTGVKKEVECFLTLSHDANSSILNFESNLFTLGIHLKDIVDTEDFLKVLNDSEKKSCFILYFKKSRKLLQRTKKDN